MTNLTLIRNAQLIDGVGTPAHAADLLIEGDRITAEGAPGALDAHPAVRAKELCVVEARGQYLSPGFIDPHSHSDYHLCIDPGAESKIRQGVTAEIGGNCGYCPAPISGLLKEDRHKEYHDQYGIDCHWSGLDEYFDHLRGLGIYSHYAQLVGHNTLRASVMQGVAAQPSTEQLARMQEMLRKAMRQGAVGFSMGLIYAPGCFADREELVALCRVAAEEGGLLAVHMRSEGKQLLEAIEEVIDVARRARLPLQISHLKTSGPKNWSKLDRALALIEEARAEGMSVDVDRYPYTASYTGLASVLPNRFLEGTRAQMVERLANPALRAQALTEILADHPEADYWDRIRISQTGKASNRSLEGMSVQALANAQGKSPMDAACDLLMDEEMRTNAIYFTMSEENMKRILSQPYCMVGSDAAVRSATGPLAEGQCHPRAFGTFPRYLKLIRDTGLLPLSTAVQRMTSDVARKFRLADRGKIAVGMKADLALWRLESLDDPADYDHPHRYPLGMTGVWVDGRRVVESDGTVTPNVRPGKILTH